MKEWPVDPVPGIRALADEQKREISDIDRTMILIYERQRADAAMERLRVAVEALDCLYPGLAFDLRYAPDKDEEEARSAYSSRLDTVVGALQAIGPLPPPPSTGSGG